jgi:hypothetical protein
MDPEEKKEYVNALKTYYKLKNAYEESIYVEKQKIIRKRDLGWKERRKLYAKLKPKCINCKRPVGSIFKRNLEGSDPYITAKCGDTAEPCKLKIRIDLGHIINLQEGILDDEVNIKKEKVNVIKKKNDLLFGYITSQEAVQNFDKLKDTIAESTKMLAFTKKIYNEIVFNEERLEHLKLNQDDFNIKLKEMNRLIQKYETTQIVDFARECVNIYVTELTPIIKKVLKDKYANNFMEYNEDTNKYELRQIPFAYSTDLLEVDYADTLVRKVVELELGGPDITVKKNRTARTRLGVSSNDSAITLDEEEELEDDVEESVDNIEEDIEEDATAAESIVNSGISAAESAMESGMTAAKSAVESGISAAETGVKDLTNKVQEGVSDSIEYMEKGVSNLMSSSSDSFVPPPPPNDSDEDSDEEDYDKQPKIKIYDESVPVPTQAKRVVDAKLIPASRATQLGYKFEIKDKELVAVNPENGDFFRVEAGK